MSGTPPADEPDPGVPQQLPGVALRYVALDHLPAVALRRDAELRVVAAPASAVVGKPAPAPAAAAMASVTAAA